MKWESGCSKKQMVQLNGVNLILIVSIFNWWNCNKLEFITMYQEVISKSASMKSIPKNPYFRWHCVMIQTWQVVNEQRKTHMTLKLHELKLCICNLILAFKTSRSAGDGVGSERRWWFTRCWRYRSRRSRNPPYVWSSIGQFRGFCRFWCIRWCRFGGLLGIGSLIQGRVDSAHDGDDGDGWESHGCLGDVSKSRRSE